MNRSITATLLFDIDRSPCTGGLGGSRLGYGYGYETLGMGGCGRGGAGGFGLGSCGCDGLYALQARAPFGMDVFLHSQGLGGFYKW